MKKAVLGILIIAAIVGLLVLLIQRQTQRDAEILANADGKPVVKIGVVYPMSGNAAFFGDGAKVAFKLFQEYVESMQTKYKYEIIFEDSQAQIAVGVKAAMRLISLSKIDVLVDCFSGVSAANSQIAEKYKTPHLAYAQNIKISQGFYNWRVVTSSDAVGAKMVETLKQKDIRDIAIIVKNADGPISMLNGFMKEKDASINIKSTYYINPEERDFRILLQKVKSTNPQIIILVTQTPDTDIILRQAKEQGISIPFTSMQSYSMLENKSLAEGDWYVDVGMVPDSEWLKRYNAITDDSNVNFADGFYSVLQVIFNTYESASGDEKISAEEFINNLSASDGLDTVLGKLTYDKQNQILDTPASLRIIKNGRIELVEE